MANLLAKAGAQPGRQTRYGILWHNNFYLGVVTQRNPLHSFLQHIEEEFYGNQPCMVGGLNTEISTKLTVVRRPGNSIYNSSTFPAINRFYENRVAIYNGAQTSTTESIQVVADTASTVYDCTGPSTKSTIWTKSSGAGSTYFQSVGNSLYFANGVDNKKLLTPEYVWAANQTYAAGDYILDSNGNIQEVTNQTTTVNITQVQITYVGPVGFKRAQGILTLSSSYPGLPGTTFVPSGMTTLPGYNGETLTAVVVGTTVDTVAFTPAVGPASGPSSETGHITVSGTSFTSGSSAPSWKATPGGTTTDGTIVWQNMGKPVQNWQIAPPSQAPQVSGGSTDYYWSPNSTLTGSSGTITIIDTNGNYQLAFYAGTGVTGNAPPVWSSVGTFTQDGSVQWYNIQKPYTWQANTVVTTPNAMYNPNTSWPVILDSNGNIQVAFAITTPFETGATAPTWATTPGLTTTDNNVTWTCCGPGVTVSTNSWQWAYSYHGVDGSVSTASPLFSIYTGILGNTATPSLTVTGTGTTDPQCDEIWIWRTVQGGSTLFFDGSIPNPGAGTTTATNWTYTDTIPDVSINGGPSLNEFIEAPIALSSNPPPKGLTALAYHLDVVWGAVGNFVQYSDGPNVASGNGNTAWNPNNYFEYPSTVTRLYPTSNGLLVFTVSDIYVIQGLGTSTSSFFSTPFLQNIGLTSYDAFCVNGAIAYLYTSDNQVLSLDPSSGMSEVGFPIGDQFGPNEGTGTFTPTSTHLTWNFSGSQEKALYVSDFTGNWWRMLPTPSPETGTTWCPMATIAGGFSAVQSVETSPGTHNLLVGPPSGTGPILKRDYSTYKDNGTAYNAYGIIGSLVVAQPGQLASIECITTDSVAIGTPLTLAIQLDEIAPLSSGFFEPLTIYQPDPTQLAPSISVNAQRFYLSQTQDPAVCRHFQLQINFGTDSVKNELLSMSVYGGFEQER